MQPELCFDLLQGSCSPFYFYFFLGILLLYVDSSVTYICQAESCHLVILLFDLHLLMDFVMFVASSVTYICQGGILLLSRSTYTHLRDFVMFVALSVTYIRQGGILLLSHLTHLF